MKAIQLILLLALSVVFCQDYSVPTLAYDQTPPTCDNINSLIAATQADIVRLSNYANSTLPDRIDRLNNALASAQKTCKIIQSPTPSLVQLRGQTSRKKMTNTMKATSTLKKIADDVTKVGRLLFTDLEKDFPILLKMQQGSSPSDLCGDVTNSINALNAYLDWLSPTVSSQYVDGQLLNRLNYLQNFQQNCESQNCPATQNTTATTPTSSYVFYPTLDTSPYDIGQLSGDIDSFRAACDQNPSCVAYNTDGWLKSYVRPPSEWDQPYGGSVYSWGLYVKGSRPAANSYTFFPSLDTSPYDIMQIVGATVDTLSLYCDTNPDCVAYNTDGWIKSYVRPASQWDQPYGGDLSWGLYIKNAVVPSYDYTFYATWDVSPYDIMQIHGADIDTLKLYCDYNPDCLAFNTDGWIKNYIPATNLWDQPYGATAQNWGLYVKGSKN